MINLLILIAFLFISINLDNININFNVDFCYYDEKLRIIIIIWPFIVFIFFITSCIDFVINYINDCF